MVFQMRRSVLAAAVALVCSTALADEVKMITVAPSGGDFTSVQAAIDSIAKDAGPTTILVKPGTYKALIKIGKSVKNVTLHGDGKTPAETVLTHDWSAKSVNPATGKEVGTSGSTSTLIQGTDITCENLTFDNSAGDVGQAVALKTQGDRLVFRNCRMTGWQDTLYANDGRNYYENCHIEGRVDFIFGRATAVFKNCTILSKNGGFVTAASTAEKDPFGYVFLDCKLTHDPKPFAGQATAKVVPTSLGRPWRAGAYTAFIRCVMGPHISPEGWSEWKEKDGTPKPARYFEYGNTGPGANTSKRVAWSKQLTKKEADAITPEKVLSGNDGWNPLKK